MEKSTMLSNKMKISVEQEKLADFSPEHARFYVRYSSFVFRALKKPSFQKFLSWMLKKEKIAEGAVREVDVKVLPSRKKNGQGIAGKCDPAQGRIRIYPKTIKFCQMFRQKFGRQTFSAYAGNRARAAIIHELLHLKYTENERTVRKLSEEYFCIFAHEQSEGNSCVHYIFKMIFRAKSYKGNFQKALNNS